ncbi:hypothetical protein SADUNF_Sadunf03G0004800 [Salix dunnii]|uniref:Uncharacterized protein n=1 Tax=Salix dunnii TaxID=1413687 RepID=A0A835K695_9ROSI|nr:hypothetical protein SADUNF_Sadunf03G0004800 [Salix dunnii]
MIESILHLSAVFTKHSLSLTILFVKYDMFLKEETLKFYDVLGFLLSSKVPFDVRTTPYHALLFETQRRYTSTFPKNLRGEDKMKHVTAIKGMWLDKLAVDQLFFHVAIFNCQNLLLLSPGTMKKRYEAISRIGNRHNCANINA